MAEFFVPHTTSVEDAEQAYAALAAFAEARVLPLKERIFAIIWHADGFDWTAEVGATLHAVRTVQRQRAGKKVPVTERSSDPATVLAVFPGVPLPGGD